MNEPGQMEQNKQEIIEEYLTFLSRREFPCVAAREAVSRKQVLCFVAGHMGCPKDDTEIIKFLYDFVDRYRNEKSEYHSAAIIFTQPMIQDEKMFDTLMWQRLQSFSDLDAGFYNYDKRVSSNPASEKFSFSLKEEAMFIIGLHSMSSRPTRQFKYGVIAFNPHVQFEKMKESSRFVKMKNIVRKRDKAYSGSVNPMLDDFGNSSEVFQYSGRQYSNDWECPLKIRHERT